MEEALAEKQAELDTLQTEMKAERIAMEDKVRADMSRQFEAEKRRHNDEVEGISREWEIERKVSVCLGGCDCESSMQLPVDNYTCTCASDIYLLDIISWLYYPCVVNYVRYDIHALNTWSLLKMFTVFGECCIKYKGQL